MHPSSLLVTASLAAVFTGAWMRACHMSTEALFASALCRPGASSLQPLTATAQIHCAGCVLMVIGAAGVVAGLVLAARRLRPDRAPVEDARS